jgi:CRISPR-associated protein Cas1
MVSVDVLRDLSLWNIDTYIMSRYNTIMGFLVNPDSNSHVKTRLCQYKTYLDKNKAVEIMKIILKTKIETQNMILRKYKFKKYDFDLEKYLENVKAENLETIRRKLMAIESIYSKYYFSKIFRLFNENIRSERRMGYGARDGLNNVFNWSYHILKSKIHYALLKAKLEPYLGFLHSIQYGKPSLVCDFEELYRYLIDELLIKRRLKLHKNDFMEKNDTPIRLRAYTRRIVLREYEKNELVDEIFSFFDQMVEIPRIKIGYKSSINTLINEEALLFAKFLRGENKEWKPRIVIL